MSSGCTGRMKHIYITNTVTFIVRDCRSALCTLTKRHKSRAPSFRQAKVSFHITWSHDQKDKGIASLSFRKWEVSSFSGFLWLSNSLDESLLCYCFKQGYIQTVLKIILDAITLTGERKASIRNTDLEQRLKYWNKCEAMNHEKNLETKTYFGACLLALRYFYLLYQCNQKSANIQCFLFLSTTARWCYLTPNVCYTTILANTIYGHFYHIRKGTCDAGVQTESMTVCGKAERSS